MFRAISDWAERNRGPAIVVLVVLITVMIFVLWDSTSIGDPPLPGEAWYYDSVTGAYFAGDAADFAPIASPGGNPSYRAYFFDCGECSEATEPETSPPGFLAYYETFTEGGRDKILRLRGIIDRLERSSNPEEIRQVQEAQSQLMTFTMKYKLVSRDGESWEAPEPSTGRPLWFEQEVRERCRGKGNLMHCRPE